MTFGGKDFVNNDDKNELDLNDDPLPSKINQTFDEDIQVIDQGNVPQYKPIDDQPSIDE